MPWGWRHAYLNDPDGQEISLYWAGENRMKKGLEAMENPKRSRRRETRRGVSHVEHVGLVFI